MTAKKLRDGKKTIITHTLADGTAIKNLKDYVVPYNKTTSPIYQILAAALERQLKNKQG